MVKSFLLLFLFVASVNVHPQTIEEPQTIQIDDSNLTVEESLLTTKIKTFLSEESFIKNRDFIKVIFSPESDFYTQDRVDVVKVAHTLKENGLLNLFFDKPQELELSFKTSGSALLFVKILGDTLRNIGYYRYVTSESHLDQSQFTWTIVLTTEYATDPLILEKELQKSGCGIIDIVKKNSSSWEYSVDMSRAYLNIPSLISDEEIKLKRSLYAHWLEIGSIQDLAIKSSFRDDWYPHITYYDKQLHLLEVLKKDKKTRNILLVMPKGSKYIKISDIYTLKNVKDNLILTPSGSR